MNFANISQFSADHGADVQPHLENAIDGQMLLETVITDLHWSALQIGMFACLLNACSKPAATWTLRSRRYILQDNAMIMQLGLRYFEDIGINHDVMFRIEKTYVHLSALMKRIDFSVLNSRSYTRSQRHALAAHANDWRTLVQTALDAITSSEPVVRARLPEAYVSNCQVLIAFLNEVIEGRTSRVNEFGEMRLPSLTQRRRAPRHAVLQSCDIEIRGRTIPATINNVSRSGLGIVCNCQFAIDDKVVVSLGNGRRLQARVVWQNDKNLGLELAQSLELDDPLFSSASGQRGAPSVGSPGVIRPS